jgi:23S rRNA (uracil1939-C5)-methyltransferase
MLDCTYKSICSGCELINKPYDEQRVLKLGLLDASWRLITGTELPRIEFISIAESGLRDRSDLMIEQTDSGFSLGLFDVDRKRIVDLKSCPQMSPRLDAWLKDFREVQIPVSRGSIRLRVAPSGRRGVWLDLANLDVKRLLEERTALDQLNRMAVVEIGQKRKRLVERDGFLKLHDPILESWFETYLPAKPDPIALYCTVGSFTQPGFTANRALISTIHKILTQTRPTRVVEFGSGIGNFTIPLASLCTEVHAYEVDPTACEGLARSLQEGGLTDRVTIHLGNYQVARKDPIQFTDNDLVFVDPPRSGLLKFIDPIEALNPHQRPKEFIYVSCYLESFCTDCARLLQLGYQIQSIAMIDQFPQSRHVEIVAHLRR